MVSSQLNFHESTWKYLEPKNLWKKCTKLFGTTTYDQKELYLTILCVYMYTYVTNQPEVMEVKSWFPIPKYPSNNSGVQRREQKEIRRWTGNPEVDEPWWAFFENRDVLFGICHISKSIPNVTARSLICFFWWSIIFLKANSNVVSYDDLTNTETPVEHVCWDLLVSKCCRPSS